MPWLHCQKIAGLEYWVQLLFNFTLVNVRQVQTGPYTSRFWRPETKPTCLPSSCSRQ